MPKIEFRENKTIKLINVLSRKVSVAEIANQNKQIQMLMNWIKAKGYEKVGPIIMYTTQIQGVDAENNLIVDSRIMVQLKNGIVRPEEPYYFENELKIKNCLMARFYDDGEKLQFALNKITLFAYENDVELTGETYMVILNQEEQKLMADIFMPKKEFN